LLTLAEAGKQNRLGEFSRQEEARRIGPIDRAEFGAAAARIIKAQRSVDRTSRSASGGNLSGKKTHPDTDQGASG